MKGENDDSVDCIACRILSSTALVVCSMYLYGLVKKIPNQRKTLLTGSTSKKAMEIHLSLIL